MKVLKTYAKFQKNMHLMLRKPLEEIFDMPILEINFEWIKWYIHLLKCLSDTPIFSFKYILTIDF